MNQIKGGKKFAAALSKVAARIQGEKLKVGFFAGATEPDGTPTATVAYMNEYGTKTSPPRPFFRNMIKAESPTWGLKMSRVMKNNDMDVTRSFELMGEGIKGQLVESIVNFSNPANAQATIAKKGFDKPLTDTATMQNSVGYEVAND